MHVVVRQYTGATALMDEMQRKNQEVKETISGIPGFVAYYAVRSSRDRLTTVTVCEELKGTEESTRRARAWVRENFPNFSQSAPAVSAGEAFIRVTA